MQTSLELALSRAREDEHRLLLARRGEGGGGSDRGGGGGRRDPPAPARKRPEVSQVDFSAVVSGCYEAPQDSRTCAPIGAGGTSKIKNQGFLKIDGSAQPLRNRDRSLSRSLPDPHEPSKRDSFFGHLLGDPGPRARGRRSLGRSPPPSLRSLPAIVIAAFRDRCLMDPSCRRRMIRSSATSWGDDRGGPPARKARRLRAAGRAPRSTPGEQTRARSRDPTRSTDPCRLRAIAVTAFRKWIRCGRWMDSSLRRRGIRSWATS